MEVGSCLAKCKKVLNYLYCTFALRHEIEWTSTAPCGSGRHDLPRFRPTCKLSLIKVVKHRTAIGVAREAFHDQVCDVSIAAITLCGNRRVDEQNNQVVTVVDCVVVELGFLRVAVC